MTLPALSDDALDQLFRTARSYNGYTAEPVTDADLHALWDLFKFGPTAANSLPARIVWVRSPEAKARLAAAASAANGPKILSASVTAIIGKDLAFHDHLPELFPHADARSWFAGNDPLIDSSATRNSSLQGAYLIIAARALGFDAGPMSGFDHDKVDAEFFAGTSVKSNFICTIGHGDTASLFDRLPRPPFKRFNRIV